MTTSRGFLDLSRSLRGWLSLFALSWSVLLSVASSAVASGTTGAEVEAVPWSDILDPELYTYSGLGEELRDGFNFVTPVPPLLPGLTEEELWWYRDHFNESMVDSVRSWITRHPRFPDLRARFDEHVFQLATQTLDREPELVLAFRELNQFADRWLRPSSHRRRPRPRSLIEIERDVRVEFQRRFPDFQSDFNRYRIQFQRRVWQLAEQETGMAQGTPDLSLDFDRMREDADRMFDQVQRLALKRLIRQSQVFVVQVRQGGWRNSIPVFVPGEGFPLTSEDIDQLSLLDSIGAYIVNSVGKETYEGAIPVRSQRLAGGAHARAFLAVHTANEDRREYDYLSTDMFARVRDLSSSPPLPDTSPLKDATFLTMQLWSDIGEGASYTRGSVIERSESRTRRYLLRWSSAQRGDRLRESAAKTFNALTLNFRIFYAAFPQKLTESQNRSRPHWSLPIQQAALRWYADRPNERAEARRRYSRRGSSAGHWANDPSEPRAGVVSRSDMEALRLRREFEVFENPGDPRWDFLITPDRNRRLRLRNFRRQDIDRAGAPVTRVVSTPASIDFSKEGNRRIGLPKPMGFRVSNVVIRSGGMDITYLFDLWEEETSFDVYISGYGVSGNDVSVEIEYVLDGRVSPRQGSTPAYPFPVEVNRNALRLVAGQLRRAGFRALATGIDTLLEQGRRVSVYDLEGLVSSTSLYTYDTSRTAAPSSTANPFTALSGFVNEAGVACIQCTGAAGLLAQIFKEVLLPAPGLSVKVVPGFNYNWGTGHIHASDGHARVGIFNGNVPVLLLDGTPKGDELVNPSHQSTNSTMVDRTPPPLHQGLSESLEAVLNSPVLRSFYSLHPDQSHPLIQSTQVARVVAEMVAGRISREEAVRRLRRNRTLDMAFEGLLQQPKETLKEFLRQLSSRVNRMVNQAQNPRVVEANRLLHSTYLLPAQNLIAAMSRVVEDPRFVNLPSRSFDCEGKLQAKAAE